MRLKGVLGSVTMTAMTVFGGIAAAPSASADTSNVALNGTYRVFSDGNWARRNEVKFKVPQETQYWTVKTDCVSPIECVGTVTSDLGWTGSIRLDDYWYIEHEIARWAPCPDGTFATGRQLFVIMGWDPTNEERVVSNTFLMGRNITKTQSGACGRNQPLVFELPVRVERVP